MGVMGVALETNSEATLPEQMLELERSQRGTFN